MGLRSGLCAILKLCCNIKITLQLIVIEGRYRCACASATKLINHQIFVDTEMGFTESISLCLTLIER